MNGHFTHKNDRYGVYYSPSLVQRRRINTISWVREACKLLTFAIFGALLMRMYMGGGGRRQEIKSALVQGENLEPFKQNAGQLLVDLQKGSKDVIYPPGMDR